VINSNPGYISYRFRDLATYSLKLFTENCGQTAADGDIVTTDSLCEVASADDIRWYRISVSDDTVADPLRLTI